MRVGSLCYATEQGLGILAKSFYDAAVLTDVQIVVQGTHQTHPEWYPDSQVLHSLRPNPPLSEWVKSLDAFIAFETPFVWELFKEAHDAGVATVLMPMHECLHEEMYRRYLPYIDLLLCPSELDMEIDHPNKSFLPVPVKVPWRLREKAEVFVHNAGHGGLRGRNGTREVLHAAQYLQTKAKIIVRAQTHGDDYKRFGIPANVDFRVGTVPYDKLWEEGDAFVFPEKHNGLSLPLQEAHAAGMLVVATDRFPNNAWLPREPLIPVSTYISNQRIGGPYRAYEEAVVDPLALAQCIDYWYGKDIKGYSVDGHLFAQRTSWAALRPAYVWTLEDAVKKANARKG